MQLFILDYKNKCFQFFGDSPWRLHSAFEVPATEELKLWCVKNILQGGKVAVDDLVNSYPWGCFIWCPIIQSLVWGVRQEIISGGWASIAYPDENLPRIAKTSYVCYHSFAQLTC